MKKLLLLILLIPNLVMAVNLIDETIDSYIKRNPSWDDWREKQSSITFLATRCAANFAVTADRAKSNGMDGEAKNYSMLQEVFYEVAAGFASSNGTSQKNWNDGYRFWVMTYVNEGKNNMNKFNSFLYGKYYEDLMVCVKKVKPIVGDVVKVIADIKK
jgi:hypothetical protein